MDSSPGFLKSRVARILAALLVVAVLVVVGVASEAERFLKTAPQYPGTEVEIDIEPGETFDSIAQSLHEAGLITSITKFKIYARLKGSTSRIQAGAFRLSTGWTPERILQQLVFGKPLLHQFSFPEGLSWWKIADLAEQNGFAKAEDLKRLWHDPEYLRQKGIPFDTAEGFLFPETYMLKKPRILTPEVAREFSDRLIRMFWQKTANQWKKAGFDVPTEKQAEPKPDLSDPEKLQEFKTRVILASLVEKETGVDAERARVAGVYANRLRIGMLLQCDPTIIYGLGPEFDGKIRTRNLEDESNPYNTYQHPGLPPGPICSPGLDSLVAALNPEKHRYLFFVAKGTNGEHSFSTNLADHNRAVNQYRRTIREQRARQ